MPITFGISPAEYEQILAFQEAREFSSFAEAARRIMRRGLEATLNA
ncbi:hypothetical protein [Synechococcus sp. 1G10]|nr:hypothetical protein [Synechococcus sp. 1G10]